MDLRKKATLFQQFGEIILRFRLIFVFVLASIVGYFFCGYREIFTWILSLSETLGIQVAKSNYISFLPYFLLIALILIPRFLLAKKISGFSFLGVSIVIPAFLFLLQGSDSIILPVFIAVSVLTIVLFFAVKHAFTCALFPAFLFSLALLGVSVNGVSFGFSNPEISMFLLLSLADMISISLISGIELKNGDPKTRALLHGIQKEFLPTLINMLTIVIFFIIKQGNFTAKAILFQIVILLLYFILFYFLGVSLLSFAPFARLRAKKRSIELNK